MADPDPGALLSPLHDLLAAVRADGRSQLLEHEAMQVAAALGLRLPHHVVVADATAPLDLGAFPGQQVVVKVLSKHVAHKTELGGVVIVPKQPAAVAAAIRTMQQKLGGTEVAGFLVVQFVAHDHEVGGELLLGLRWSREFGPLVTLGLGGVTAEKLAATMVPDEQPAILSPTLASPAAIERLLQQKAIGLLATGRLRGQQGRAALGDLVALVQRAAAFAAAAVPFPFAEIECNPVTFVDGVPYALDALVRLGEPLPAPAPPRPLQRAARLLQPRRIAVLGVSSRGENPGRIVLRNTLAAGFPPAAMLVIKPGETSIDGVACVPDLAALPEPVDMLVVAVPAAEVGNVLDEVLRTRKAEGIVLLTSGIGEREGSGDAAVRLGTTLRAARGNRDWSGPVINGPNCLGLRSHQGKVDTLFIPHQKLPPPTGAPLPIALVSQSGAFAIARLSRLPWLLPRTVVTAGNQLDLSVADWVETVHPDPAIAAIGCYVEGFPLHDGLRLAKLARDMTAAKKLLICYRAGRTSEGSAASASHTASLAGDWAATRALLTQAGALVAESIDDFEDLLRLAALLAGRAIDGLGVGVISNAGFECVAIADSLGPLQLARFTAATRQQLAATFVQARIDGFVDVHHPLDLTPIAGDRAFADAAAAVLADPGVHVGVLGCVPLTAALATLPADVDRDGGVVQRLLALWHGTRKAMVAVVDSGPLYDTFAARLEANGLPVFRSADRATRLLGRYAAWRRAIG
ncbi:MAG: acetate--CoA ligase family protein [Planctomycetes bacterium]|nr:acetate--CoA ligase family protein [Planctomycetota bacterium]